MDPQPHHPAPPARPPLASVAPLMVWVLQFVALQALLGLGCLWLDAQGLRRLTVAIGCLSGVVLVLLARRSRRARPTTCLALAGVGWSTLAVLWLTSCEGPG